MRSDDEQGRYGQGRYEMVPNSLTFSQQQVNQILGYSLAKLYQELIKAPLPEQLQALLDQLEAAMAEQQRHPK